MQRKVTYALYIRSYVIFVMLLASYVVRIISYVAILSLVSFSRRAGRTGLYRKGPSERF